MIKRTLRQLSFSSLWDLLKFSFKYPKGMYHFVIASYRCVKMCDRAFGKTHHLDNPANAIRHALWNMLIIRRLDLASTPVTKAISWSQTITDWHEDFSVNKPLPRAMDLHNNAMGRLWYEQLRKQPEAELLNYLIDRAKKAVKVVSVNDFNSPINELVYITN